MQVLVLLGDGPMRSTIETLCASLGIEVVNAAPWEVTGDAIPSRPMVFLPGFRQLDELPKFYSQAIAFIHASTVDQWGLVVNEAMASGLPVLVSRGCGCAPDLVQEGVNGWTFDPTDEKEIARLMLQVGAMSPSSRAELGIAGQRIIEAWGPERFAEGCRDSAANALALGAKKVGTIDRLLLAALIRR
jgi:glycosyltransferase involved in cell wall biosynthesis